MYVPLTEFAPDRNSDTEGILLDCSNMLPAKGGGYVSAPSAVDAGLPPLESAAVSAASLVRLDGLTRTIVGTQLKLFERGGDTWVNVSNPASLQTYDGMGALVSTYESFQADATYDSITGGAYIGGARALWRFAQFGNITLATNKVDPIQASASDLFSNLAGSPPKAALIDTVLGFVIVADTNDVSFGDSPDRWWCSALFNHESWSPSSATQAATARLTDPAGKITASKRLGDNWIIYKERAVYVGTYTGPPFIWEFQLVSDTAGALTQESVVNVGTAHLFVGYDDIYYYDGSRPVPISGPIKQWFLKRTKRDEPLKINTVWDRRNSLVYFFFSSSSAGLLELDECVVYNYDTNKWGRADQRIDCAIESIHTGKTYDEAGESFPTFDLSPPLSTYDGLFVENIYPEPAVIGSDHALKLLSGSSGASSIDLWDIGDDVREYTMRRVRPRLTVKPDLGKLRHFHRSNLSETISNGPIVDMLGSRFDIMKTARWHRTRMEFNGNVAIHGVDFDIRQGGYW